MKNENNIKVESEDSPEGLSFSYVTRPPQHSVPYNVEAPKACIARNVTRSVNKKKYKDLTLNIDH